MASIIKRIMRHFNGTDWDKYYPETSADQVKFTKTDGTETDVQKELSEVNSTLSSVILGEIITITTTSNYYILPENEDYYLANAYAVRDDTSNYVKGINRRSAGGYTLIFDDVSTNTQIRLYLVWCAKKN